MDNGDFKNTAEGNSDFIDKAIEGFCDIEIGTFGYKRPY